MGRRVQGENRHVNTKSQTETPNQSEQQLLRGELNVFPLFVTEAGQLEAHRKMGRSPAQEVPRARPARPRERQADQLLPGRSRGDSPTP